jgi:hypothetical protein
LYDDVLAVGARRQTVDGVFMAGKVYIFQRMNDDGSEWTQMATLQASDKEASAEFGHAVVMSDEYCVVAAPNHDAGGISKAGQVYVFRRDPSVADASTWTEHAILNSEQQLNGKVGTQLSLYKHTLIVSSPWFDVNVTDAGRVWMYELSDDASEWTMEAVLDDSAPVTSGNFGQRVSLHGNYLAVGAIGHGSTAPLPVITTSGRVYVYKRDGVGGGGNVGGTWTQQAMLQASDKYTALKFGNALSLYDDYLAVGTHRPDGGVYVFVRSGSVWSEQTLLKPNGDVQVGYGYAAYTETDGLSIVVGSTSHSGGGNVYVYEVAASENQLTAMYDKILRMKAGEDV